MMPPSLGKKSLMLPSPCSYDEDTWTEVAKHLCSIDLLCLSGTCRWFYRFVAEDTLWRYAFFRDLDLAAAAANPHTARPPKRSWRNLYLATFSKHPNGPISYIMAH